MSSLVKKLFAPVDICWLALFRILFGCVMLVEVGRYFAYGWVDVLSSIEFNFTYYGFDWIKPWPGPGMHIHFAVLGVAAACVALGFCYRIAMPVFFLGFCYVFLLDETRYLNHFYLICLLSFLMIFMPAHRAWSLDAWLRPSLRSGVVPAWTLWLMRFQIGVPYVFGGIAKLSSDWLHGEPMRKWLAERMSMPLISEYGREEWFVYSFVFGGLLLDLFVIPCLLWRRTRIPALCAVALFHDMNSVLFQIGIFPWLMLGATFIFFPPDAIRRFLGKMGMAAAHAHAPHHEAAAHLLPAPGRRALAAGALAVYGAFQVLMPFRHLLYPLDVHWSEEGHRFAWHMKLRTKRGQVMFELFSPSTGQRWTVDPFTHLRHPSSWKMATHPDMILQYSHYLADQKRREGFADIEVRARALVSLNGRAPQDLINPATDLAKEPRTLAHADWILPLTEPLPSPSSRQTNRVATMPPAAWFSEAAPAGVAPSQQGD